MSGYKRFSIEVPAETHERLSELDSDRLDEVMVSAVEGALDTVDRAEERREELHARRRGNGHSAEELADGGTVDDMTDVEKKQTELREKIRGGR